MAMTATTFTPLQQQLMTLSALAATDETPITGESPAQQAARILGDLNSENGLDQPGSATAGVWTATWVGVSSDSEHANVAFIAQNGTSGDYAVAIRGTDPKMKIDVAEDMDVGSPSQPFTAGGQTVQISQGALQAHTAMITAVGPDGTTTLLEALQAASPTTLSVTGHSLGGAMATTIGLYLMDTFGPSVNVTTFAAPTAGLDDFATLFATQLGSSYQRFYNAWDVIPNAWATLESIVVADNWYPMPQTPGPTASADEQASITKDQEKTDGMPYAQPVPESGNEFVLNQGNSPLWGLGKLQLKYFDEQLSFQHQCNTYLELLGAPPVTVYDPHSPGSSAGEVM